MTRPHRRCRMPSANAFVIRNIESRLTERTRRQSLEGDFVEGLHRIDAGVVDEDVAMAAVLLHRVLQLGDARRIADVAGNRGCLTAGTRNQLQRLIRLSRSAITIRAPCSANRTADALADARRGAGNDRGPSLMSFCHYSTRTVSR